MQHENNKLHPSLDNFNISWVFRCF